MSVEHRHDPQPCGLPADRQFIVVSNREPYVHRHGPAGVEVERPAGGLVAALDPVMQAVRGTWIAWGSGDADFEVADAAGRVMVPPGEARYVLRRLRLSRDEVDGFYNGYANQALWPLCHMAMEHARFRRRAWEVYQAVNARFADAVAEEARGDAFVWIQDYHLARCPRALRRARPDLFLMHFWHIPWPAWDVFRACPQSADLVDGLLANDLVVFQHPRHAQHFIECAEREVGARADAEREGVEYDGRMVRVAAIPISVDFATWDATSRSRAAQRWMTRLRGRLGTRDRLLAVSVDRLDYTKGIPERLRAIDLFFRRFPQFRSRVVFVQKCAPSRTGIRAYRELQQRVEAEIARLNATYGTPGWQPVVYLPRPLPPPAMAALYRMADLCIVSSLADGMNLVAKEFVACQVDGRGVLALSELAGARDELPWALPVNPYDAEGCAEIIAAGLRMPAEERGERMAHLRRAVEEHDIGRWLREHLRLAARLAAGRAPTEWLLDRTMPLRQRLDAGRALALLLDFDGTLARLVDDPARAEIPAAVRASLARIARADGTLVAVISGRALGDIRARVGLYGLVYAGNHGLEMSGPGWNWSHKGAVGAREALAAALTALRARLRRVPGVLIEDKGYSASVHYRRTPAPRVEEVRVAVMEEVARVAGARLAVRRGKQVLEIRPAVDWDKGAAARWLLVRTYGDGWPERAAVVYVGDDRTDEDAFVALGDDAVTVRVGAGSAPTAARYAVRSVEEVHRFLELLETWMRPAVAAGGASADGR
ncbi:MAG: bifunctional alpha,alpha-trehalose-phosphate synthase (UDP-forming)/trehalose-phosphatase [Armatimonadota bacterium]|nr:bifunctional alpha,alpha-trehalose-phosphate synthase (UDP-forming)/trehalose-phosphatase [Armatimonadota bacterium]